MRSQVLSRRKAASRIETAGEVSDAANVVVDPVGIFDHSGAIERLKNC